MHLKAFGELNAEDAGGSSGNTIALRTSRLKGNAIYLDYPSVGATENIMLAAIHAEGVTVIRNAAREPEIVDLQCFLNTAGADVQGAGTSVIRVNGRKHIPGGAEYTIMPDRIVAGTYMTCAAAAGGRVVLNKCEFRHLTAAVDKLRESGCEFIMSDGSITMTAPKRCRRIKRLVSGPYPGFPTDLQAQFMAMLTIADGTSAVRDTVFENRCGHVRELIKMGASVSFIGGTAVVDGCDHLTGCTVKASDLRAGAALITAGLAAEGITVVEGTEYIERGYADIAGDLRNLGADIDCR